MRTTSRRLLTGLAFFLVITAGTGSTGRSFYPYSVKVYSCEEGWGYDILLQGRTIIHQPFIPAQSGKLPFPGKESAGKAGMLVIRRLTEGRSPGLTAEEIRNILD